MTDQLNTWALTTKCTTCNAQPNEPCTWRRGHHLNESPYHLARFDRSQREREKATK